METLSRTNIRIDKFKNFQKKIKFSLIKISKNFPKQPSISPFLFEIIQNVFKISSQVQGVGLIWEDAVNGRALSSWLFWSGSRWSVPLNICPAGSTPVPFNNDILLFSSLTSTFGSLLADKMINQQTPLTMNATQPSIKPNVTFFHLKSYSSQSWNSIQFPVTSLPWFDNYENLSSPLL